MSKFDQAWMDAETQSKFDELRYAVANHDYREKARFDALWRLARMGECARPLLKGMARPDSEYEEWIRAQAAKAVDWIWYERNRRECPPGVVPKQPVPRFSPEIVGPPDRKVVTTEEVEPSPSPPP
ncbi:MAG: hypothetical protein WAK40_00390 [Thermoplasmata archaeon]